MENKKELLKLASVFNTENIITSEDIEQVLKGILTIMNSFKKDNQTLNKETTTIVENLLTKVIFEHEKLKDDVSQITSTSENKISSKLESTLEEVKGIVKQINAIERPKDGKDADEEKIIESVLSQIKLPEQKETILDTPEEIADKLESLKGDNRLDASAIKNLPEIKGGKFYGGSGIKEIIAGTGVTVDNTNLGYPVVSSTGGGGASTLADVSTGSTDATKSLYTMTSTIPVEFKRSGGASLLYLDETNGRVGLGTTAPDKKLTLSGGIGTGMSFYNTDAPARANFFLTAGITGYSHNSLALYENYDAVDVYHLTTYSKQLFLGGRSTDTFNSSVTILNKRATTNMLYVNSTSPVVIQAGGNVGIGTASAPQKLTVDGNIQITNGQLFIYDTTNTPRGVTLYRNGTTLGGFNTNNSQVSFYANTGYDLQFTVNSSVLTAMTVKDSTGNVGIGTTTPTAVLHLKAGTATAGTAPIKFTSGTVLTTPEAGTIEFDGTDFFFTI